jgi:hypothetical protein
MNRRGLITGLISLGVTAPAIVRASALMPVKVYKQLAFTEIYCNRTIRTYMEIELIWDKNILLTGLPQATWRLLNQGVPFVKNDYLNDLVYHA